MFIDYDILCFTKASMNLCIMGVNLTALDTHLLC